MNNYEHIVQEHVAQKTVIFNKYANILQQISELKEAANKLNQENLTLKKILSDVYPLINMYEKEYCQETKYSDIIRSITKTQ